MKKIVFGMIPLIILIGIIGCAGGAKPVETSPVETSAENYGLLTLDQAINEAAIHIDGRIERGSKIAPLNFNSPHDRFSNYVLEELTANLVDSRVLTVVDRREIDLIRNEFDFQFSGEVGDDSMQRMGQMLGAQSIISGSFTDMGGFHRIMIRVLNVENATVEVQYRANIVSDTVTTALLTGGRTNVASNSPSQSASTTGTQTTTSTSSTLPTTPAAPVRYTVAFNANGASGTAPFAQTVENGESITIPDVGTMTNSGRNFGGWNTRSDGSGTSYIAGSAFIVNANTQLFARWIEHIYKIGDTGPAGGLIFYDKGNNSGGWRYLEAASRDAGNVGWGPREWPDVSGTRDEIGSGKQNTQIIVNYMMGNGANHPAAMMCNQYRQEGYSDWFLPSKSELNLLYWNLKQQDLGGFRNERYWSSSQASYHSAWNQNFGNGEQAGSGNSMNKTSNYVVRPIRAF